METYENTILKWIGYVLFLVVIAVHVFNIGGSNAESMDTQRTVTFGTYEQDNNPDNGPEAIEWIVLDEKDGKALLLSKYGLDSLPFHSGSDDAAWEKSSLRSWLNTSFMQAAFTPEEQAAIQVTAVSNGAGQGNSMSISSADTQDRVFLLSYAEACKLYFSSNEARLCAPTGYAVARGAWADVGNTVNGQACGSWWLRSPADSLTNALIVDFDGGELFCNIHFDNHIVRPAIWVDLAAAH
ncbi:MAG: hypothetical protein IKS46_00340 [Clostridia bacterium]|nr:hypothetical protein [Clostridia bacterium]